MLHCMRLLTHCAYSDCVCVVVCCVMRPYTEGRLDPYRIGIPRELPKSALNLG